MAFLDFFKKKGGAKTPKRRDDKARKDEALKEKKGEESKKESKPIVLKESRSAWRVLGAPHVTEKSANLTSMNQYVFRAIGSPPKGEVRRAVEEVYGVHVEKVRKVEVPRRQRRRGRRVGWRPAYMKAIVTLRQGEKIEVLPH